VRSSVCVFVGWVILIFGVFGMVERLRLGNLLTAARGFILRQSNQSGD
jgi:hypothetical protein